DRMVASRVVMIHLRWRHDDLGSKGTERVDLLLAHFVGHRKDATVSFDGCRQRQPHPCIAGCSFNDGPARLDPARFFRGFEHRDADTVFHAAAGIQILEFRKYRRTQAARDTVEPYERCIADHFEDVAMPHFLLTLGRIYNTTSISSTRDSMRLNVCVAVAI